MVRKLEDIELVWMPLKGIGPFRIGAEIKNYINEFSLELVLDEMDEGDDWETFRVKGRDDIRVCSADSKVESIICDEYCYFKGKNLIGLTIEQLVDLLDPQTDVRMEEMDLDDGIYYVYDFDDYSCQVWVKNNLIETFTAGDYID